MKKLVVTLCTLQYKSSRWMDSDGRTISTCLVYNKVQVEVLVENPARKQTITSLIKAAIFRDIPHGLDERVKEESRLLTLPPTSTGTISISFIPRQESGYYFTIHVDGKGAHNQLEHSPHRLYASRSETALTLDELTSSRLTGSTVTFTGKLVKSDTGEGIAGADIYIFGSDKVKNKLMASGTTGGDGTFSIEWIAEKIEWWDSAVETYAKFKGDDVYKPSTSNQYTIRIKRNFNQKVSLL